MLLGSTAGYTHSGPQTCINMPDFLCIAAVCCTTSSSLSFFLGLSVYYTIRSSCYNSVNRIHAAVNIDQQCT
jgi:hypothetical protein